MVKADEARAQVHGLRRAVGDVRHVLQRVSCRLEASDPVKRALTTQRVTVQQPQLLDQITISLRARAARRTTHHIR